MDLGAAGHTTRNEVSRAEQNKGAADDHTTGNARNGEVGRRLVVREDLGKVVLRKRKGILGYMDEKATRSIIDHDWIAFYLYVVFCAYI